MATADPNSVNIVQLANAKIFDEQEQPNTFGKLWTKQTTMFVFLRHFACIACRTHAKQIWEQKDKYQQNGAKIVFIGNGSPHFIHIFRQDLQLGDAPIYTDPSLESFRAAGFKRGFLKALGPTAIKNGLKMASQGNKQSTYTKAAGDLWQLGGVLVVKPDGTVPYHYISEVLGDYPPEDDLKTQK